MKSFANYSTGSFQNIQNQNPVEIILLRFENVCFTCWAIFTGKMFYLPTLFLITFVIAQEPQAPPLPGKSPVPNPDAIQLPMRRDMVKSDALGSQTTSNFDPASNQNQEPGIMSLFPKLWLLNVKNLAATQVVQDRKVAFGDKEAAEKKTVQQSSSSSSSSSQNSSSSSTSEKSKSFNVEKFEQFKPGQETKAGEDFKSSCESGEAIDQIDVKQVKTSQGITDYVFKTRAKKVTSQRQVNFRRLVNNFHTT